MNAVEKQIADLGWTLAEPFPNHWCAFMRHFLTPMRDTPEQVLRDVQAIKEKGDE